MQQKSLNDWLAWQEQLHPQEIELGLERVARVARQLPFYSRKKKIKTITVGGTNGKGSCAAYLEAILLASKYRVGVYTSPHLLRYNERVRVNGSPVSDQSLCDSFAAIDAARLQQNEEISLTYFEFGTLAALDIFDREEVDVQILEVGLGGRLDAVNIMEADGVILTNVALDHQAWLGEDRESIGREKAGIFRAGIPLVLGEVSPPASVLNAARELGQEGRVHILGRDFDMEDTGHGVWHFSGKQASGRTLQADFAEGQLSVASAACAVQVLLALNLVGIEAIEQGISKAALSGRQQRLDWRGKSWVLDVAHNTAAASFLVSGLERKGLKPVAVIFAAMGDKDLVGLMRPLARYQCPVYLAPLSIDRSASLEKLLQCAGTAGVQAQGFDTIGAALQGLETGVSSENVAADEVILVCGSFYTVAEVLQYMKGPAVQDQNLVRGH